MASPNSDNLPDAIQVVVREEVLRLMGGMAKDMERLKQDMVDATRRLNDMEQLKQDMVDVTQRLSTLEHKNSL